MNVIRREYIVATFFEEGAKQTRRNVRTYLRDYNEQWPGCIVYRTGAISSRAAREQAIDRRLLHESRRPLLAIWVDGPDSEAARAGRGKGHGLAMRVTPIEADTIRVCLEQPELDYAREKWGLDALADRFREHFWRNR